MTAAEYKIFLKLLQIKPLRCALEGKPLVLDPVPFDSRWQSHNPGITERNVDMAIERVRFEAKTRK